MKHFSKDEFVCNDGCGLNFDDMDLPFVLKLNLAREYAEIPFKINSSIRCKKHNKIEGGSKTSSHLIGLAVDIDCPDSHTKYRVLIGLIRAGFTRIGIGPDFIHADDDNNKPKELVWGYK